MIYCKSYSTDTVAELPYFIERTVNYQQLGRFLQLNLFTVWYTYIYYYTVLFVLSAFFYGMYFYFLYQKCR